MISLFVASLLLLRSTAADASVFTLDDVDRVVGLSTPEISPDGKRIALVVSHPKPADNTSESEIVLVDVSTGSNKVLTHDRRGVASPKWSPSGDRLGFLAVSPGGVHQVYSMPMDGGDAEMITTAKEGVQQFAWRPDGNAIAYAALDETPEKKGLDSYKDMFEVGDNDFLQKSAPVPSHLWVVDADGKNPKRLTSGSWTLPVSFPPGPPSSPISWTPDGKAIAVVKQDDPHTGQGDVTTIQIVNVATKQLRPLTNRTRLEAYSVVSPDGRNVSYIYPKDGDWVQNNEIYVSPVEGGLGTTISSALDRCPYRAEWMPDSKSLLVAGNDSTQVAYWIQPLHGPATRLDMGKVCPTHGFWPQFSIGHDGTVAFLANEPDRPTELYVMRTGQKPTRLTDFNHELDHRKVGVVRLIEWRSDKFTVNGTLTMPPNFDQGKKYPLLLMIHGGPNSASLLSFGLVAQVMASHGYIVFQPNYRGSDNLGNAFYRAIEHDAGDGPGRDVMAGLTEVEKYPYINSDKVSVTGWSYGGYMTTWLIGHYGGWKCAVAGAPVTDFVDTYNLSDGNVGTRSTFGSSPYVGNAMREYRSNSPISYASHVKTPTLLMCDTGDFRVPITQTYSFYHALKDNGTTVKFFAIPVDGHFPGDRERGKEVYRKWLDWVDSYMGGKAPV